MRQSIAQLITAAVLGSTIVLGCGPSCPEVKSSLAEADMAAEDAYRVNQLVSRRKMAMEQGRSETIDQFKLDSVKFSVTAFELAIQLQLRIIMISPEGTDPSDLYEEQLSLINEVRCELDDLIAKKTFIVSQMNGSKIRDYHDQFKKVFRKTGELSSTAYERYYENGIKAAGK